MTKEEKSPAKWALDLYDHGPPVHAGLVRNPMGFVVYPLTMTLVPILRNLWMRRPYYAGIQSHIGYAAMGLVIAYLVDKADDKTHHRRDAIMRHYVSLYPERFPEPPHPKFADVLYAWRPVR